MTPERLIPSRWSRLSDSKMLSRVAWRPDVRGSLTYGLMRRWRRGGSSRRFSALKRSTDLD
ncbi:hypothetical protein E2C01_001915 [Portunus trituberculatus]|uniref:Uncharacterized protein n=1 Tax=Portunus trituberculatus TaxID=210409 RepID=A0A5B7CIF8_PORTR|nr:hypothetical protein [Portunus trituberculatus]